MTEERRSHERVNVHLPVKWDALSGAYEAYLDDISLSGCFVNTPGRVEMNEIVSLEVQLPSGQWLALRGEVKSAQPGVGFGMNFTFLTEDEETLLKELIEERT